MTATEILVIVMLVVSHGIFLRWRWKWMVRGGLGRSVVRWSERPLVDDPQTPEEAFANLRVELARVNVRASEWLLGKIPKSRGGR